MIFAAADYGRDIDGIKPPRELENAFICERYHCLPHAGGLYDQPAGMLHRMSYLKNVYEAHRMLHDAKGNEKAKFWTEHPEAGRIIRDVQEMRRNDG